MRRILGVICAVFGIMATLVGCNSAPSQSGNTTKSSSASNSSEAAAPKVPHPVDVDRYRLDPCALVPETTLQKLKLGQPETDTAEYAGDKLAKSCDWTSSGQPDTSQRLHVTLLGLELDEQYEKQKVAATYLKPTKVDEYPAIYDIPVEQQRDGHNGMVIGVNSHESIRLSVFSSSTKRAKSVIDKAAASIVSNIQSGGQ